MVTPHPVHPTSTASTAPPSAESREDHLSLMLFIYSHVFPTSSHGDSLSHTSYRRYASMRSCTQTHTRQLLHRRDILSEALATRAARQGLESRVLEAIALAVEALPAAKQQGFGRRLLGSVTGSLKSGRNSDSQASERQPGHIPSKLSNCHYHAQGDKRTYHRMSCLRMCRSQWTPSRRCV